MRACSGIKSPVCCTIWAVRDLTATVRPDLVLGEGSGAFPRGRVNGVPSHPQTKYGRETEAFMALYRKDIDGSGWDRPGRWACEQVEMRLGYARRLARRLRHGEAAVRDLGITWSPWMGRIMLYYYYPEKL